MLLSDNTVDSSEISTEIKAKWRVDYYSKDREVVKHLTLFNLCYNDALQKAIIRDSVIDYEVFDIYYV